MSGNSAAQKVQQLLGDIMQKKNPNEPKLDTIKLTPKIKLYDKTIKLTPSLDKNNPLIWLIKNDPSR